VPGEEERIAEVLRLAGLWEVVESLPNGIETIVGTGFGGATDLSGGQWQRLALARLLYHDAPLIILDEPSASLDPLGERQIFALLKTLAHEKIILFTTHRYDTIRQADRIVVLVDGHIAESGTHEELEQQAGAFWSLIWGRRPIQAQHRNETRPSPTWKGAKSSCPFMWERRRKRRARDGFSLLALFPLLMYSRALFRVALPFRKAFLKNQDITKGIAEPKSFRPPGRRLDRRPKSASWHILLIQRLDIGDANITHPATLLWWFLCWIGDIELQSDPVPFANGKPLIMIGARKAELPIKGQGLLHISDQKTRSNRIESGVTLLGC